VDSLWWPARDAVKLSDGRLDNENFRLDKDLNFVTALARGLDILRCFTPERPELGTTEIARLTGLAQSTVWRLCYTLSKYGCLTQASNSDRLRIGAGVLLLGHAAVTHTGIGEVALPLMRQIADRFEVSVSLAQRHRQDMVIVQRAEAQNILKVDLHIGSTLSIANSSLGLAYIAAMDGKDREELLAGLELEHKKDWPRIRRHVDEAIAEYQRLGFVFNLGRSHKDINAIGVPVISADGRQLMALTCGGATTRLSRDTLAQKVAPVLQDAAAALSLMLASEGR
jgi:DNA-binding IclR family transcriptional regulator